MTYEEKLKALYKKCFDDKWDCDNDEISVGDYCAFCYDTRDSDDDVCCSVDGNDCRDTCLIDESICGSEDSLMVILDNVVCSGTTDNEKINEAFDNVREALKEHM